jgi:hypothetical protein
MDMNSDIMRRFNLLFFYINLCVRIGSPFHLLSTLWHISASFLSFSTASGGGIWGRRYRCSLFGGVAYF